MAFYHQNTLDFLFARLNWARGITPKTVTLVPLNNSTSGRAFKDYHELNTVENLYACVPYADISDDEFIDYMSEMRERNVKSVLTILFDNEERANYRYCYNGGRMDTSGFDYSATIQAKERLLDDLLGLNMAISCIELFMTTDRLNATERSGKFNIAALKQELEGVWNDDRTRIISKGLYAKFGITLEKVKNILFPIEKRRAVIGRHPW